jgi:orotate phosphoribosyltransferase
MKAITAVRAHGATVAAVLTLVDREEGAGAVMEAEGIPVFALFTGGELLEAAQESAQSNNLSGITKHK